MHVLVVDDDPAGRYLLQSIITSAGHRVTAAVDGEEALAAAEGDPPDVAISDILMPKMDGYQLCRAWKSHETLSTVPLVFYTASYTDPADEQLANGLGVDGFWRKPMDPAALLKGLTALAQGAEEAAQPRRPELVDETEVLQEYNRRLVHKLEEKAASLERANVELKRAMEILAEEVSVKANLIAELNADAAERKRITGELRAERDFTRQVIDFADLFICVIDPAGAVVLFSTGAERITGYRADEVVGRKYGDLFVPEQDMERYAAWLDSPHRSGTSTVEYAIKTAGGGRKTLQVAVSVSLNENGAPVSYSFFGTDVTEQRHDETAETIVSELDRLVTLDAAEEELLAFVCDAVVERFGFPLVWAGLIDGEMLVPASACGSAAGYASSEPVSLVDGAPYIVLEAVRRNAPVFRAAEASSREIREHAERFGLVSGYAVPLTTPEGLVGVLGFYSALADEIDERVRERLHRLAVRAASSLVTSRSRAQVRLQSAALESAGDAIAITGPSGVIEWCNPAFERATGVSRSDSIGIELFSLASTAQDADRVRSGMQRAVQGQTWYGEALWQRRGEGRFVGEVTLAPVVSGGENAARFVALIRDVTTARQLDELRTGFVAMVSHELRTPLTSIIGYADVLGQLPEAQLVEKAPQVLAKLRANGVKMKHLVEELLEVSTMQWEGVPLLKRSVDLEDVVRLAAERVDRGADHQLVVRAAEDLPEVFCDPERIGRAVSNIVSNAVKYSPDGGPIDVSVALEGDEAIIAVTDHGVGIPSENVPVLFDRFIQGDMSTTRRFGGIGLGLFVADQFARAHGGRIEVESEPGRGSTFTIHLPPR